LSVDQHARLLDGCGERIGQKESTLGQGRSANFTVIAVLSQRERGGRLKPAALARRTIRGQSIVFWHESAAVPALGRAATTAALLACLLGAGGCQSSGLQPPSASSFAASEPELRRRAEDLGREYDRNPDAKEAALRYAQTLRRLSQYPQAAAILQRLAAKYPGDTQVLGAYGKALADAGRLREAAEVLAHAHTPERPDWSILSAQGSVADELGEHEQAQAYYAAALKIVPSEPHVLSNLGLSYALTKKLPLAEKALKEAATQPGADGRVRQNLAFVLALEGKFAQAEDVSRNDLDSQEAAANVTAIRRTLAQNRAQKELRPPGAESHPAAKAFAGANLD
jgi:Flp pilus assembly protein TadD